MVYFGRMFTTDDETDRENLSYANTGKNIMGNMCLIIFRMNVC